MHPVGRRNSVIGLRNLRHVRVGVHPQITQITQTETHDWGDALRGALQFGHWSAKSAASAGEGFIHRLRR